MGDEPPSAELLRRIERALDAMPPRPRAVFECARWRDLDNAEIAAELGLSVRQVECALAAALVHIKRCVDAGGGP